MMNIKKNQRIGKTPRQLAQVVLVGLCALVLTSCGIFQPSSPKVCPRVSLLNEAAKLTQYRDGPGRDLIDVLYEARVHDVNWACGYSDNRLRIEAKIDLVAQRGPASKGANAQVPYFVAIIDKAQNIIAKAEFESEIEFRDGRRRAGVREEVEQIIYLKEGEVGTDYEIIVGLQLTAPQLKQNRGSRF